MAPLQSSKHDRPTDFSIPLGPSGSETETSKTPPSSQSRTQSHENQKQITSASRPSAASTSKALVFGNAPEELRNLALDIISSRKAYAGGYCQDIRQRIQLNEISVLEDENQGSKLTFSSISEVDVSFGNVSSSRLVSKGI